MHGLHRVHDVTTGVAELVAGLPADGPQAEAEVVGGGGYGNAHEGLLRPDAQVRRDRCLSGHITLPIKRNRVEPVRTLAGGRENDDPTCTAGCVMLRR